MNSDTTTAVSESIGQSYSVESIAAHLGAEVDGLSTNIVSGVNSLDQACEKDITFIRSVRHAAQWSGSRACAALVTNGIEVPDHDSGHRALLIVPDADLAMAELLVLFAPATPTIEPGIHPTAFVDETANIDASAAVGPNVTILARTRVGRGTVLEAGVHLGEDVVIGEDCILRPGVVIGHRCTLHDRVSIHSNAVIGADGFGYRPDNRGGLCKMEHIGTVVIHNDVEIGACSTVDRGKFGETIIGEHTKLDNLVQIGHNVRVGRCCVLASQAGIAGSSVIGDFCQLGAKSGLADHRVIGDRVQLAATAGVMHDVPDDAAVGGIPGIEIRKFWRVQAATHKLPALLKTVARLEEELARLKNQSDPSAS